MTGLHELNTPIHSEQDHITNLVFTFKLAADCILTVTDRSPVCRAHLLLDHLPIAPPGGRRILVHEIPRPHGDALPAGDAARRPRRPRRRRALGDVVVLGDCKTK